MSLIGLRDTMRRAEALAEARENTATSIILRTNPLLSYLHLHTCNKDRIALVIKVNVAFVWCRRWPLLLWNSSSLSWDQCHHRKLDSFITTHLTNILQTVAMFYKYISNKQHCNIVKAPFILRKDYITAIIYYHFH